MRITAEYENQDRVKLTTLDGETIVGMSLQADEPTDYDIGKGFNEYSIAINTDDGQFFVFYESQIASIEVLSEE